MYSPQIDPALVRIIYRKAKEAKTPMTKYVNAILREKLIEQVVDTSTAPATSVPLTKPKAA